MYVNLPLDVRRSSAAWAAPTFVTPDIEITASVFVALSEAEVSESAADLPSISLKSTVRVAISPGA